MPKARCHVVWALDPRSLSNTSLLPSALSTSPMQTVVITYLPLLESPHVFYILHSQHRINHRNAFKRLKCWNSFATNVAVNLRFCFVMADLY